MKNAFITEPSADYELIDSGDAMKLERYGDVIVLRPDPQALWRPQKLELWKDADAVFQKSERSDKSSQKDVSIDSEKDSEEGTRGKWVRSRSDIPEVWPISYGGLKMGISLTPFKHTGLFPEQIVNWQWMAERVAAAKKGDGKTAGRTPTVLNLFGYTGGASLACAQAGAEVTHVDASRAAITWANENAAASGLKDAPIRWMLEDAYAFVKKEVRRGRHYDGIVMDPPAFGRGAKGEVWKIERDFLNFFEDCLKLLSDDPVFVVVNGYAAGYSAIAYENNLKQLLGRFGGTIESGELCIRESSRNTKTGDDKTGRLLPAGIVSRWSK